MQDHSENHKAKTEGKSERLTPTQVSCLKDQHRFVPGRQKEGVSAQCDRCHIGFLLPAGAELKENHIYLHGTLLV